MSDMVQKANVVVTTSKILEREMKIGHPEKPCVLIPNGCDIKHFSHTGKRSLPTEFISHRGPIITYCGAWARWIDQGLVEKIARTYPEAMLAIIGVEFGASAKTSIPNIKYLGYKSYEELPPYLWASTVCIIPFLLEEITLATNPIKMYEYLAAGKPVVSTDLPEARQVPGVFIGKTHEEFLGEIQSILEKKIVFNHDRVQVWLEEHTWETRFLEIQGIMEKHGFPARV